MRSILAVFPMVAMIPAMLAGAVSPAGAQDTPKPATTAPSPIPAKRWPRPGDVQKVFVLKHVRADDMADILSVFPADISHVGRDASQTLGVSAAPAVIAAIEETIRRLDVPPPPLKTVEVTAYILECSTKGSVSEGAPAELEDVVAQLKQTFGYTGCGLGPSLFARAAEGSHFETSTRGQATEAGRSTYTLRANRVMVDSSRELPVVRFWSLSVVRSGANYTGQSYSGDVDARSGQRVIVGKLGSSDVGQEQVLVLTAKVVD